MFRAAISPSARPSDEYRTDEFPIVEGCSEEFIDVLETFGQIRCRCSFAEW